MTLAPGRYWQHIVAPHLVTGADMPVLWAAWKRQAVPDFATVLAEECGTDMCWVLFEVHKPVPWPSGLGKPTPATSDVATETDVIQVPEIEDTQWSGWLPTKTTSLGIGIALGVLLMALSRSK